MNQKKKKKKFTVEYQPEDLIKIGFTKNILNKESKKKVPHTQAK